MKDYNVVRLNSHTLFLAQIIAHCGMIYWFFNYFTYTSLLIVFFVYFLTGCFGMSVIYHRLLTHKSFKTHKIIEYLGTFFATIGLTGSSITWTATHRMHHIRADRYGDPHSPKISGYLKAQWMSMFANVNVRKSPILKDNVHRLFHKYYFEINLIYGLILFFFGGIWAVLTLWLVPAAVLWNAGSLINTVCHTKYLGYRNYNLPDNSVNNPLLGLLMWGEGWHNNHHRFQNHAKIGKKWWEIDIGYYLIILIKKN